MLKRVRIKDIAVKAGVSVGTVDRVLHARGNVSEDAREKVLRTLDELGYERNLLASALAYNKVHRIAALLPDPSSDPYWEQPFAGVMQAYRSVQHYGIQVDIHTFDLFKPDDFMQKAKKVLEQTPDGLLFPPLFQQEGIWLLEQCHKAGIATVIFNTLLETDWMLSYIGQDSYQSGVLAARLLNFALKGHETVMVLNLEKGITNARHILEKERGFRDYFHRHNIEGVRVVRRDFEDFPEKSKLHAFWQQQLRELPELAGVFVTNSRAYHLADCLEPANSDTIKIVGFDLLAPNIAHLHSENINFLVNQNSVEQGYLGIMTLFRYLFLKESPENPQYLPLDIVVAENVQYYLKKQQSLLMMV